MDPTQSLHSKGTEVAVIGAGPYGLSIAAYLLAAGVSCRVFGRAMSFWSDHMPRGMHLKSDGFASSIADVADTFTLKHYCAQNSLPYHDRELPVPLETFVAYGHAFQRRFVPGLESCTVLLIRRDSTGFLLDLDTGERLYARHVVMALGILPFARMPESLSTLPNTSVSHSSEHADLSGFSGKRVVVIGAGSSAADTAALLVGCGASVQVVARESGMQFHSPPHPRTFLGELIRPTTGIGAGLDYLFYTRFPNLFRLFPERLRLNRLRKTLGPSAGWFVRQEIEGKVPILLNREIRAASVRDGVVSLDIEHGGQMETLACEHVIAATGYRVDIDRVRILDSEVCSSLRLTDRSPWLSANFESSVPGLYFVGVSSAATFGPMMRFAYGARYTARRLSWHLQKTVIGSCAP